jgi:peptidoglycan/LPS O-acetylase OafA/YrhL
MNNPASKRFLFVDALRGVAALSVVLFHLTEANHIPLLTSWLPSWVVFILEHGNLGVAIFFVLSGFVIAHSVHGERVTIPLAGRFMLRRSLRLEPPYWFAIALTIGFAALSASIVPGKAFPPISLSQCVAHVLYLQEVFGYPEINSVFWTLCLEVQFYLVYVFILVVGKNDPSMHMQGRRVVIILCLAIFVSLLWPVGIIKAEPWKGSFFPLWHGFLLGVAAYWSWRYKELRKYFTGFVAIIFIAAVFRQDSFSLVCGATATLLLVVASLGRITSMLPWVWLQFLGTVSYSLYLIHNPITGASFRAGYILTGDSLLTEIFWTLATVGICIFCSAIMYYLVEKPSIKLSRMIDLNRPLTKPIFVNLSR